MGLCRSSPDLSHDRDVYWPEREQHNETPLDMSLPKSQVSGGAHAITEPIREGQTPESVMECHEMSCSVMFRIRMTYMP